MQNLDYCDEIIVANENNEMLAATRKAHVFRHGGVHELVAPLLECLAIGQLRAPSNQVIHVCSRLILTECLDGPSSNFAK